MATSEASVTGRRQKTSVYRNLSKGASKRLVGSCKSDASTSSSVVARRTPLSGYVITVAIDNKKRIHLYGSSADKAGLCVGDQIIEVNGTSVNGKEHSEIVRLIHECIKSRLIQLRVRRKQEKTDSDQAPVRSDILISDAYLVAPGKDQADEVTQRLKRTYPGIKTHNMEMLATGNRDNQEEQEQAKLATCPAVMNGHLRNGIDESNKEVVDEENERLKGYEMDLKKRREIDEKKAREDAFLRDSLRGSKKLQKLETETRTRRQAESTMSNGAILNGHSTEAAAYSNSAFASNETTARDNDNPAEPIPLEQVILSVNRVADHLINTEGRTEESKLLRDFFMQQPVQQAIENTALHRKNQLSDPIATTSGGHLKSPSVVSKRMQGDLRIVKINKSSDSYLGATVRNEGEKVVVGRVVRGGIAEKGHLLNEGDELIEVNGQDLRGKNITEVCDILRSISGELSLVVAPTDKLNDESGLQTHVKHYKALFDYDPEDDTYVPCKELALKFQRGDILHVMNTSDENWWQAYRDGDDPCTSLAGLIPSISFQQQIAICADELERGGDSSTKRGEFFICTKTKNLTKKLKKSNEELKCADEIGADSISEILTYEEVSLYLIKTGRKRPLVLCGPEGVGCLELRQRLVECDKDKYASPVPHTTRPKKQNEIDGVHYHFVNKQKFNEDAKAGKFIEYGEYQKYMYGTSMADIQILIDKSKTCLLTLKAENLNAMRRTNFMPYIIFIAPPSLQQLRRQKEILGQHGIKDETLKIILNEGKSIEKKYGHLFDRIIINVDLDRSLEELKDIEHRLETEPQWIPSFWLSDIS